MKRLNALHNLITEETFLSSSLIPSPFSVPSFQISLQYKSFSLLSSPPQPFSITIRLFSSEFLFRRSNLSTEMVRISNNLVGILNFVTFLLSIPILGAGIWLSTRASTDCEKFLERPVIALGVFLMVVSLAGLIGACCSVSWLLWLYLFVMFLLILLVFCFTIFAFVVTSKGAGEVVSGRGYKEYRLGDYSNWLQKRVLNDGNWAKIRSCIRDSKVCNSLSEKNQTFDEFINDNLSPLQVCNPSNPYLLLLISLINFKSWIFFFEIDRGKFY